MPYDELALFEPFEHVPDKAARTAGVRLRFFHEQPGYRVGGVLCIGCTTHDRLGLRQRDFGDQWPDG
ncbi:hypothetical protein [Cerasicoccus arenae]|uniref:hypothetical protein n=1 Tax=Cerasicoccus arenae TaxID=424488 RepID=UPI0035ED783A